jgi:hypothetical protein
MTQECSEVRKGHEMMVLTVLAQRSPQEAAVLKSITLSCDELR